MKKIGLFLVLIVLVVSVSLTGCTSSDSSYDTFHKSSFEEGFVEPSINPNYGHFVYDYSYCSGVVKPESWETLELFMGNDYTGFFKLTDSRHLTVKGINVIFSMTVSNTGEPKLVINFLDDNGITVETMSFIMEMSSDYKTMYLFDIALYQGKEYSNSDSFHVFRAY